MTFGEIFPIYMGCIWDIPAPSNGGMTIKLYLEDHPMTCKWLVTKANFRPLRIGLWDPFHMAFLCLIHGGDPNYLQVLG